MAVPVRQAAKDDLSGWAGVHVTRAKYRFRHLVTLGARYRPVGRIAVQVNLMGTNAGRLDRGVALEVRGWRRLLQIRSTSMGVAVASRAGSFFGWRLVMSLQAGGRKQRGHHQHPCSRSVPEQARRFIEHGSTCTWNRESSVSSSSRWDGGYPPLRLPGGTECNW